MNPQANESVVIKKAANLFRGIESVGGKLTITNEKLLFEPHKINIQSQPLEIPFQDIERAEKRNSLLVVPNGMKVIDRSGREYKFVVWGRDEIIDLINKTVGR